MLAGLLLGPRQLKITEVPQPPCPSGGLLLKVGACGLCSSDIRVFLGRKQIRRPQSIAGEILPGHILGHEIAGVIEDLGAGVDGFRPGDHVTVAPNITCGECDACRRGDSVVCRNYHALGYEVPGGFAEYLAVPAPLVAGGSVNRYPPEIPAWTACLAEPLACVINAQDGLRIGPEDSVLILGAGAMGCLHIALARYRRARTIIVSEPDPGRRTAAMQFGADLAVDPNDHQFGDRIHQATQGEGISAVIVAVSSIQAMRQPFLEDSGRYPLLAPGARISVFAGLDPGDTVLPLNVRTLHYQAIQLIGSVNSTPRSNAKALRLIVEGAIPIGRLVSAHLPLTRLAEALELAVARAELKIAVLP